MPKISPPTITKRQLVAEARRAEKASSVGDGAFQLSDRSGIAPPSPKYEINGAENA
jgi:hypothetical protein